MSVEDPERGREGLDWEIDPEQSRAVDHERRAAIQRLHRGELISAGSAVLLLALMFLSAWYGVAEGAGRPERAENAWHGLTLTRWLMLLTILVAVGSMLLHVSQRGHGTPTDTSRLVTGLGFITALLLIYRVLINLPAPNQVVDQKLGGCLGVVAAFGIAVGGYEAMREQRRLTALVVHRVARRGEISPAA